MAPSGRSATALLHQINSAQSPAIKDAVNEKLDGYIALEPDQPDDLDNDVKAQQQLQQLAPELEAEFKKRKDNDEEIPE